MIPIPPGMRVWLAAGRTDMRRGMNGLALQIQQSLERDPHAGDLYVFRGRRRDLIKILWHDGLGMSLYAKRLERAGLSGPRQPRARCRARPCSSATCSRGSTGGIRNGPSIRRWQADPARLMIGAAARRRRVLESPCAVSCRSALGRSRHASCGTSECAGRQEAEARASGAEAFIAHLKLSIAKLRQERFGASAAHGSKFDQLQLQLEELEVAASQDRAAVARLDAEADASIPPHRRPARRALPTHLPSERAVIAEPAVCPCCQGLLTKLGEDVTETLGLVPRSWKVIQTVRERLVCRACEISQAPAPFHPSSRGRSGPELLATMLEAEFGQHLPLNRQSETFARKGIALDVSTLAD